MLLRHPCSTSERLFAILLIGAFLIGGCRPPAANPTPPLQHELDALLRLMQNRLALMHDVARSKWGTPQPITDPKREQELLDKVVARGREKMLDPNLLRTFFSAQMEGAREIQQADFDGWSAEKQKPFTETPSLGDLRKQIDALNNDLIDALARVAPHLSDSDVQQALRVRSTLILDGEVTASVRQIVLRPLLR